MTGFSVESLTEGIKKCEANILIFEEAIKKERRTQEEFRQMIEVARQNEEKRKIVNNGVQIVAE